VDKQAIKDLINNFYTKNKESIKEIMKINQKKWIEKEEIFKDLVLNLFNNKDILSGKYRADSTMWRIFPRFIESGCFSVPASPGYNYKTNEIIAHEMLHFAFYKYINLRYPEFNKKENTKLVWHISEIFNAVLQSTDECVSDFGVKGQSYPEHKEIYGKLIQKYEHKKNIQADELIEDIVVEVKKSSLL